MGWKIGDWRRRGIVSEKVYPGYCVLSIKDERAYRVNELSLRVYQVRMRMVL